MQRLSFDPYSIDLPVKDIITTVKNHLAENNTLIVNAPPGAGKSTLLPLSLLEEPFLNGKKILMLEPRRLAAKSIAQRMASLLGEAVGETVGYRIRFENRISQKTSIEVLTEGILTRMIHSDNTLNNVALVIFDEYHERSLFTDVAMALCRHAQKNFRPDLRIMVMSATLNLPALSEILQAPIAQSLGKQYPVEIKYSGSQDLSLLPEMAARIIKLAVKENKGDVLVFLPGEGEIKKCETLLKKELRNFIIHPLYGQLPPGKQFAAIMPDRNGKRKIVLATSIAETSLTIEGIAIVVDSGFTRTSRFDPKSGLSKLDTILVSKDSADQRAGRAGRLQPGVCYRMWTAEKHDTLLDHRIPEILEADLSSLVLDMALCGITNVMQLTWLTPPPLPAIRVASDLLHQIDALKNGLITDHGRKIHALPCHPRIANMLLYAHETDKIELASDLAAILEERDPLPRDSGIDINERVKALRRFRKESGEARKFKKIEKIAGSYRRLFNTEPLNEPVDPYETGVLLAHCYPERIAFARPGNNAQFQLANGKYASAHHKDDLAHEPWLVVANLDAREGMGKIFLATPLNPKDLANSVKEKVTVKWDTEDGELTATKDICIGSIVLRSTPLPSPDDSLRPRAISQALKKSGEELLLFTHAVKQWQNKVLSLRNWFPSEGWPDVSTHTLLLTNEDWLLKYLADIETPEDLYQLDLLQILKKLLGDKKNEKLEWLAPEILPLPNGKFVPITYYSNGDLPTALIPKELLNELNAHPKIGEGKIPVILLFHAGDSKEIKKIHDILLWKNNK